MDPTTAATTVILAKVFDEVWKPSAKEVGEILAAPLRRMRERRDAEARALLEQTAQLVSSQGGEARPVPGRVLWPILDYGSQADDDNLRAKWRAMLANAADGKSKQNVRPLFARILSELTAEEVRLLDWIFESGTPAKTPRDGDLKPWAVLYVRQLADAESALGYDPADLVVMLSNFYRQGICEPPGNGGRWYDAADGSQVAGRMHDTFFLTPLGVEFVKACRYP
jgi:hypothetical protein